MFHILPGEGNDFVVSFRQEAAPSHHIIEVPVSLWQAQDANGLVVSLQIEDQNGQRTRVGFPLNLAGMTCSRHGF
jgi:hypothetical protein